MCATMYGWHHLVKATEVTTGMAESNGILSPGGWLSQLWVDCLGPMLGNEYGRTLPFSIGNTTGALASS